LYNEVHKGQSGRDEDIDMTTANARIAIILAGCLMLGLGTVAERASAETPAGFSQAELDQMLAPIALYPDTVLSHVLIAATYPLEVVQAARWSRSNPGLDGEYAVAAVEHYPWDPSVMALVAFPELLARMDADLEWTQRLGDAFLIQEYQVLDTVQYLRDEAYASGHLRSNEYVRVVRETEYIYIEPSVTRVVYVPWYDPHTVYRNWRWSAYPPVYWHQPSGYRSGFSFHWGNGHHLQYGFFFSAVHWPSHRLVIHDHYGYYPRHDKHYGKRYGKHGYGGPRFASGRELARFDGARHWKHDRKHRRGVAYRRGIDERHTLRASEGSNGTGRRNGRAGGHYAGQNDNHAGRRNDRRDLLRDRSQRRAVLSQGSTASAADSSRRDAPTSDRSMRSRDSIRRDSNSILDVARSKPAASTQRNRAAADRSGTSPRNAPAQRRAARDQASVRRDLAQRRTSKGTPMNRRDTRDAGPDRAGSMQPGRSSRQPSSRPLSRLSSRLSSQSSSQSSSQASPRSSSRSSSRLSSQASSQSSSQASSRPARTSRAAPAPSRASAESRRSVTRGSRPAVSRKAPARTENRTGPARSSSRDVRAEAPRQARREHGKSSRAQVLRSRGRDRDRNK